LIISSIFLLTASRLKEAGVLHRWIVDRGQRELLDKLLHQGEAPEPLRKAIECGLAWC
jgi:hypothetical protein